MAKKTRVKKPDKLNVRFQFGMTKFESKPLCDIINKAKEDNKTEAYILRRMALFAIDKGFNIKNI